jgi:selenocysteine-specific elongation factor
MSNIVLGTAGHIDHGKSTLVLALTGIDPDRLKEEKARGITIELGFAHATIGDTRVAFVDVPGHERFVRTMLAGVGGIDCVLLIVACDESVMPQTREHFEICRLLQIPQGIIVLTKADAADGDTRAIVRQEVKELVAGSFLESAPMIEVSAVTSQGLDALRAAIVAAAARVATRPVAAAVRLPIDRAFSMRGFGTVVTGTLVSGRIRPDDELVIVPGGRQAKVRGLQVHGASATEVVAGQRTAINLGGVEIADVARGQTLIAEGSVSVTRRADAVLDLLPSAKPIKHGARVRLHNGTSEVLGRISIAGPSAVEIPPGGRALIRLRLESEAVLNRGDRFIIRAYSPPVTVGGGRVLDPAPSRPGIRSGDALAGLERLAISGEPGTVRDAAALEEIVVSAGLKGVATSVLIARGGVAPSALAGILSALLARKVVARIGDRVIAAAALDRSAKALVDAVTAFHRVNPLSDGLPREEARERLFAKAEPAVFDAIVERLKGEKILGGTDRLALAAHKVAVSGEDARVKEALAGAYRSGGLKPPDAAALAAVCEASPALVERMSALLVREKTLVRVDTLLFHADALRQLKAEVASLKDAAPNGRATVDVGAFKDRYGVSRKFAIPLLEYLDRERVTRRTRDVRLVL